jgi:hypothetical protein
MNERIKELVDQILPNEKEWHKGDPKDWGYFFSGDELEKFAELLIRDCARIADIAEPWQSGDLMLDYFGIQHDNRMQP